jgi:hypothetical protein
MQILNLGLRLSGYFLVIRRAEDHGEFVGPADVAISIQQPFPHFVQRRALPEDQIVAVLDLGTERLVPVARFQRAHRPAPEMGAVVHKETAERRCPTEHAVATCS